MVWFANVGALAGTHRVFAIDHGGRSVLDGKPFSSVDDLMTWLDSVFAGLDLDRAAICGHSYGSWIALRYAVRDPQRVSRLALLDPTDCFASLSPSYRLRAVPLILRPNGKRLRAFYAWETGGAPLDPDWLTLAALEAERPRPRIVLPRPVTAGQLAGFTVPTLVVLAGQGRAHDIRRVEAAARELLPRVEVVIQPGTTHHTMPMADADTLNRTLLGFLG
jgi:pimeloyl-ACP methyl ester carboxylesterase